jgi:hypothetical protein
VAGIALHISRREWCSEIAEEQSEKRMFGHSSRALFYFH